MRSLKLDESFGSPVDILATFMSASDKTVRGAREHLLAALLAALIVLFTSIPYLYGSSLADDNHVYVGLSPFRSDDANVYLGYMRQIGDGAWTVEDRFNSTPTFRGKFDLFFLALTHAGRWLQLSNQTTYRVSRVVFGWLLLMTIYFVAASRANNRVALLAMLIAGVSSGLGWLFRLIEHPIGSFDVMPVGPIQEATTFGAIWRSPLHIVSMMLLLLYFHFLIPTIESGDKRRLALAALCALILGNIHTYDFIVMIAAPAAFLVVRAFCRQSSFTEWLRFGAVAAFALPGLIHVAALMRAHPQFGAARVPLAAFSPVDLGVTYGLLLPLAVVGFRASRRHASANLPWATFLGVWAVVGLLVPLLLPFAWKRKTIEGTHIPLALLTAYALSSGIAVRTRLALVQNTLVVLMLTPSNLLSILDSCLHIRSYRNELHANVPAAYLHRDERNALAWMLDHVSHDSVCLSTFAIGNFVPGWAGCRAFAGHVLDTIPLQQKIERLMRFFNDSMSEGSNVGTEQEASEFLIRDKIDFIFYGPREQSLARGGPRTSSRPFGLKCLRVAYQNPTVTIFRVIPTVDHPN